MSAAASIDCFDIPYDTFLGLGRSIIQSKRSGVIARRFLPKQSPSPTAGVRQGHCEGDCFARKVRGLAMTGWAERLPFKDGDAFEHRVDWLSSLFMGILVCSGCGLFALEGETTPW